MEYFIIAYGIGFIVSFIWFYLILNAMCPNNGKLKVIIIFALFWPITMPIEILR